MPCPRSACAQSDARTISRQATHATPLRDIQTRLRVRRQSCCCGEVALTPPLSPLPLPPAAHLHATVSPQRSVVCNQQGFHLASRLVRRLPNPAAHLQMSVPGRGPLASAVSWSFLPSGAVRRPPLSGAPDGELFERKRMDHALACHCLCPRGKTVSWPINASAVRERRNPHAAARVHRSARHLPGAGCA